MRRASIARGDEGVGACSVWFSRSISGRRPGDEAAQNGAGAGGGRSISSSMGGSVGMRRAGRLDGAKRTAFVACASRGSNSAAGAQSPWSRRAVSARHENHFDARSRWWPMRAVAAAGFTCRRWWGAASTRAPAEMTTAVASSVTGRGAHAACGSRSRREWPFGVGAFSRVPSIAVPDACLSGARRLQRPAGIAVVEASADDFWPGRSIMVIIVASIASGQQ